MKRYLIEHSRSSTWDLIDEDGQLSVERYHNGKRERFTIAQFEKTEDGPRLAARLKMALARSREQG